MKVIDLIDKLPTHKSKKYPYRALQSIDTIALNSDGCLVAWGYDLHDEVSPQVFIINGLTIKVASGGWRSPIGGTPSAGVTIPAGITCLVTRLV